MSLPDGLSRWDIKQALGALIETKMVGAGLPAQVLYRFQKGDMEGQSPVVMVVSAGMAPRQSGQRMTFRSPTRIPDWSIEVWHFALWKDKSGNYLEEDAEKKIDDMAEVLLEVVEDWGDNRIELDLGNSSITRPNIGGDVYLWEPFPIMARLSI